MAVTLMRPPSRVCMNCLKPMPARAEQVLLGHAQPSKDSGRVSEAFQPILR